MNAEIVKMRKMNNDSEIFDHKPERIPEKEFSALIKEIEINFSFLEVSAHHGNIDIDFFANIYATNMAIILGMFNRMGIYPDYFYDAIIKLKISNKDKIVGEIETNKLYNNYQLYKTSSFSKVVKDALDNQLYRVQTYPRRNLIDAVRGMTRVFNTFNIPYNLNTLDEYKWAYNQISCNCSNITLALLNSDDIYEDVEYMAKLLFECISFFVAMGINPNEYLDKVMLGEDKAKKK